jgi:hypothetical protein
MPQGVAVGQVTTAKGLKVGLPGRPTSAADNPATEPKNS